jgi:serine/threonine-protein kinase RsbW
LRSAEGRHHVVTPAAYPGSVAREQDQGAPPPVSDAGDAFELRLEARVAELHQLRHALSAWLARQGAPPEVTAEVALATHEAAANVVEHAYPDGTGNLLVRARRDDDELLIAVQDEGHWRTPSRTYQRGRGLTVMRRLTDEVVISPTGSGTTVMLRRRIAPTG